MSKDDETNVAEEKPKKKRVVRVVKRVKKRNEADGPDGATPDSLEEKVASAFVPSDAVEDKVEKQTERARRHSKRDKPVGPDTLDSASDVAPKVRRAKRTINGKPALSEWAQRHQSALFYAKVDRNSHFVASDAMMSLNDEIVAINKVIAKATSSELATTSDKDALTNEVQIVQEKYSRAKADHIRNIDAKTIEAEAAFNEVVAEEIVFREKRGLVDDANRILENIESQIVAKRKEEERLITEIDAAQKDLVLVREEVKRGIVGEIESRKKANILDEEELVKLKSKLDAAKERTATISQTLGKRLQQQDASKEKLSDIKTQPKEEQPIGFFSRAAARVKEITTSAKEAATTLEVAARDKLIESARADLDTSLQNEERLTQEAELLSTKILTNKQAVDEMERDPDTTAESSQRVQNQKVILEGKVEELSRNADSITALSAKQVAQKDEIKRLGIDADNSSTKVGVLQKVAEEKLESLRKNYTPKMPANGISKVHQMQSSVVKEIEGGLDARIKQKAVEDEIEIRIFQEREKALARARAEKVAEEQSAKEAILRNAQEKEDAENKIRKAKEDAERQAAAKIKEEENKRKEAAALKVRQEEEAKQKERDRVSLLSSTEAGLRNNRRNNRNFTIQLNDAKERESEIIAQDTTGKYKDLLAAQKKVKDWESKLNEPKEDKKVIEALIRSAQVDLKLISNRFSSADPLIIAQNRVLELNTQLTKNDQEFSKLNEKASTLVVTDEEKKRIKEARAAFALEKPEVERESQKDQEANSISPVKSVDDAIKQAKDCVTDEEKAQVISAYVMQKIEDAKARYKKDNKDIVDVMKKVSDKSRDTKVSNKDSDHIRSDISQIVQSVYDLDSENAKKLSTEVFFGALKETGTVRTTAQWIEKKIMNIVQKVKEKFKSKDKAEQKCDWKDKASALKNQLTHHASRSNVGKDAIACVGHQNSARTNQGYGF